MGKKIKINENGSWDSMNSYGHHYDSKLSQYLQIFLNKNNIKTLVDFGCGTASYVQELLTNTNIECEAYDGNPHTPQITNGVYYR